MSLLIGYTTWLLLRKRMGPSDYALIPAISIERTLQDTHRKRRNLAGKKIFSTLDLKEGYWQVELDNDSSMLCTFGTPFGCYRFTRMLFGLASASEIFRKGMRLLLTGLMVYTSWQMISLLLQLLLKNMT